MIRREAIEIVANNLNNSIAVSANGYISRDLYESLDRAKNFYMIGSMGLASSIALGISLKSKKKVYVFDGDGNILMNLGSLVTVGSLKPKNLVHIIFDNNSHESTGGQPTNSNNVKIELFGKISGYRIFKTNSKNELEKILKKIKNMTGPILLLIKVKKSDYISKRIEINPIEIKNRFMEAIK